MALLTIDGTPYEVWVGSPDVRRDRPASRVRERFDGTLSECITGAEEARVWPVRVGGDPTEANADGFLSIADAWTLAALLNDEAAHTLEGDLFDAIEFVAENVAVEPTGAESIIAIVSFNAVEKAA